MIHHVGLEVAPDALPACIRFWSLLGWEEVDLPSSVADDGAWLERRADQGAFQIHLQVRAAPVVPRDGHVALVDPNLDVTVLRLVEGGHEVLERERHWGARRIFTRCPAGHRVELMAAPPS